MDQRARIVLYFVVGIVLIIVVGVALEVIGDGVGKLVTRLAVLAFPRGREGYGGPSLFGVLWIVQIIACAALAFILASCWLGVAAVISGGLLAMANSTKHDQP